jgi:hypothetical protein
MEFRNMSLLEPSRTLQGDTKTIGSIFSPLFFCITSLFFWAIIVIEVQPELIIYGIPAIIAIIYAIRTIIAKKDLDYKAVIRYSLFTKIWAVAAYILGVFCLFCQLVG